MPVKVKHLLRIHDCPECHSQNSVIDFICKECGYYDKKCEDTYFKMYPVKLTLIRDFENDNI